MPPTIRLAHPEDGAALAALYAPYVLETAVSFETEPPSAAEMAARVERTLAAYPWLVAEVDGEVAGYAYGAPFRAREAYRRTVETTVYVGAEYQRRGVGRVLYGALLAALSLQGYRLAVAAITLPNPGSVALHEALGFAPAGTLSGVGYKLGAWRDTGWWQLPLAPPGAGPGPVLPLAAVVGTPAWAAALSVGGAAAAAAEA